MSSTSGRPKTTKKRASVSWLAALTGCVASFLVCGAAAQQGEEVPTFSELEARGAVIGEIRVVTDNIFDANDPRESNILFRAANALHMRTRPWLIEQVLLFKSGERVSKRVIDETERVIRQTTTVYDVTIRPVAVRDNLVDIEVRTRDTWTLQPSIKFRREGGVSSGAINIKESNLAGTGTTLGIERNTTVDRTGTSIELSNAHLIDGWTSVAVQRASYDDGTAGAITVTRPFYALDTRWAAGASVTRFDRRDAVFEGGERVGDYRHFQHTGQVFAGHSAGLVGRWTHRQTIGLNYLADAYEIDPSKPPPIAPPADRTLAGPYFQYEAIEDDFLQVINRDRIQRPEYFQMGLHTVVQVGRSMAFFGATEQPWQLSTEVSKGFRVASGHQALASARYSGLYGATSGDVRSLGTTLRYYVPQQGSFLLYFAGSFDAVQSPSATDELLLGGDTGMRGYPIRYQRGMKKAVFTAEERYYTDWYVLRLFRVGWVAFVDVGRAWDTQIPNATPGWIADAGIGFRMLNARASFGNVLHVDFAFPIRNEDPTVSSRQLVLKTGKQF